MSPSAPQIKSRANLGRIYSLLVSILLRTFRAWVLPSTVGTQVSITALGGTPIADSTVPLSTGLGRSAIWLSRLFLPTGAGAVPGSVILEVTGFKVLEATKFGKLDMLNFSDVAADCFVKVDDFGVGKRKGSEKLKNVFGILLQFKGTMGEGTEDSGRCGIPSNGPISMGLDGFRRFGAANGEIKVANGGGDLVIGNSGEESGEDDVKIDRPS